MRRQEALLRPTFSSRSDREERQRDLLDTSTYSSIWSQKSYKRITDTLGLAWSLTLWKGTDNIIAYCRHRMR